MSATDANTKEQLVKNVKAWIQMDNEIKEFQKEIKVRFNWCQKFCLFYVFVSVTYSNYIFYNEFYLFFFFSTAGCCTSGCTGCTIGCSQGFRLSGCTIGCSQGFQIIYCII